MPEYTLADTHAHLADARFDRDRDEVLDRAREAGITAVIGENRRRLYGL